MPNTIGSLAHIHEQMGRLKALRPGTMFSVDGNFYEVTLKVSQTTPDPYFSYVTPGETKNRIGEINAAIMRGGTIETWNPKGHFHPQNHLHKEVV